MRNKNGPAEPARHSDGKVRQQREAERTALLVALSNVLLVAAKYALAVYSGSTALLADAVHSATDVVNSIAIYVGLLFSKRKTRQFPYGLYKIENLAALVTSLFILLAGVEILREILKASRAEIVAARLPAALAGVAFILLWTFLVSRYEQGVGKRLNSPSLMADAQHVFSDLLSTAIIFLALAGNLVGLHLDKAAAAVVVLFIFRAGVQISLEALRVLLDASLDYDTLDKIKSIILSHPQVKAIHFLKGRNSGRFKFVEAEIEVRESRLARAHKISSEIERKIKSEVPGVDEVLLHYEPFKKEEYLFAVPLAQDERTLSAHFGEASYFAFLRYDRHSGRITEKTVLPNPFLNLEKARGIAVAEWLVEKGVDTVLVPKRFEHKGPAYVLHDAEVEVYEVGQVSLDEVTQRIQNGDFLNPETEEE